MLLEREDALKQLLELATHAKNKNGNLVLLDGEAGVGKTALLHAFKKAHQHQYTWIWSECDPLFTPRPLGPIYDMSPSFGISLNRLMREGGSATHLFNEIFQELEHHSACRIIVIEDLHWADHATLDLLMYLGRRISRLPLLLVLSLRSDEVDGDHPLRRFFGALPRQYTQRITLNALSPEGLARLGVPTGYSLDSFYKITGGNPFFALELLAGPQLADPVLPVSIKDAVNARLIRLAPAQRQLLETISVIPGQISPSTIKSMAGAEGETLTIACVAHNLLSFNDNCTLRFRHELQRLAIFANLSLGEQRRLHAQVLGLLLEVEHSQTAGLGTDIYDRIVHHACGAKDAERVLSYAPRAAQLAQSVGAHKEAAAHFANALGFVDQAPFTLAAELYDGWAYEAGLGLRIDEAVLQARHQAIAIWRSLGRSDKLGKSLRLLSRLHWYRGESTLAHQYANESINVLESSSALLERALAYCFRSQLHMLNDQMDDAIAWGERALEIEQDFPNAELRSQALNNIGTARVFRNDSRGIPQLQESLALSLAEGFHEQAARLYTNFCEYALEFRRFDLAEPLLSEAISYVDRHDLFAKSFSLLAGLALLRLEQGRLAEAKSIATEIINAEHATLLMRLPGRTVLATCQLRADEEDAITHLERALEDALATGEQQNILPVRLRLLEAAWLNDKEDLAHEQFKNIINLPAAKMHCWRRSEFAIWAQRLDFSLPKPFYADLMPPHKAENKEHFQAAADQWLALGLPYSAALSLMQKATPNAYAKAHDLLREIHAKGALKKLKRLIKACNKSGVVCKIRRGPYAEARQHPAGLTRREQQILKLMVKGEKNIEIADSLARSQRTIEHHISAVLAKLNVTNRTEAILRVTHEPSLLADIKNAEISG